MPARSALITVKPPIEQSASVLVLHQAPGGWGLPSLSPFCLKLQTYLRMRAIPFRCVSGENPAKGPKGKIPWIEHPGGTLGDSGLIIEYLEKQYGHSADQGLSASDAAVAHGMRRLLEESLAWALAYDRWIMDGESQRKFRDIVLGKIPPPLRRVITPLARRDLRRQLHIQGMGRHSPVEVHAIGRRDIAAVAEFLGAKPFLMGKQPTSVDACAYGVLANILQPPLESPMKEEALGRTNLVDFVERIRGLYFA